MSDADEMSDGDAERRRATRRSRKAEFRAEDRRLRAEREAEIAAAAEQRQRDEDALYQRLNPNDSRHRPASVDPLLKGAARAMGKAATSVRRGHTYTKWQMEE